MSGFSFEVLARGKGTESNTRGLSVELRASGYCFSRWEDIALYLYSKVRKRCLKTKGKKNEMRG